MITMSPVTLNDACLVKLCEESSRVEKCRTALRMMQEKNSS